jgi:hypothetical protein
VLARRSQVSSGVTPSSRSASLHNFFRPVRTANNNRSDSRFEMTASMILWGQLYG